MPEGAPTSALGERSGAPSGLRPSSFVMCNTPVEVQFTSAGCLNYPCRTPPGASYFPAQNWGLRHCDQLILITQTPPYERRGPTEGGGEMSRALLNFAKRALP